MAKKELPAVYRDPKSPVFKTIDAAADAVSTDFAKYPNEHSAVAIKRPDGLYEYSTTSEQNDEGFAMRVLLPKGYTLAGIVHSHPGGDDRGQVFSPDDLQTAGDLKVPSFVRFAKDNSIRKFTPGATTTQKTDLYGSSVKTSKGDPIAALLPDASPVAQAAPDQAPAPTPGTTAALIGDVSNRDDPLTQHLDQQE